MNTSFHFRFLGRLALAALFLCFSRIAESPARAGSDDMWKTVLEALQEKKGDRAVAFVVYEPIWVANGGPANGNSELVEFNGETIGLQNAILQTFNQVAGTRPWRPTYFEGREPVKQFYLGLRERDGRAARLAYLKATVAAVNEANPGRYETLVYSYINDTEITVYVYDINTPDGFHFGRRAFPADAGQESRRATVKNAFRDALENAYK